MPFVFMDEHGFLCWPACNTCFLGSSSGKEFACNVEDLALIPGSGRSPGERNGNPLQYYCLEKSLDKEFLVSHSPWDRRESDTTE